MGQTEEKALKACFTRVPARFPGSVIPACFTSTFSFPWVICSALLYEKKALKRKKPKSIHQQRQSRSIYSFTSCFTSILESVPLLILVKYLASLKHTKGHVRFLAYKCVCVCVRERERERDRDRDRDRERERVVFECVVGGGGGGSTEKRKTVF